MLCRSVITAIECLNSFEICNLLQGSLHTAVRIWKCSNSVVSHIVILRVVVRCDKQLLGLLSTSGVWIAIEVTSKYIDRLVECSTSSLKEELAVVKEGILSNLVVKTFVSSHGKGANCITLITQADVTISKVVRCILCKTIGAIARRFKGLNSTCIVGRAVGSITEEIVIFAAHLAIVALCIGCDVL